MPNKNDAAKSTNERKEQAQEEIQEERNEILQSLNELGDIEREETLKDQNEIRQFAKSLEEIERAETLREQHEIREFAKSLDESIREDGIEPEAKRDEQNKHNSWKDASGLESIQETAYEEFEPLGNIKNWADEQEKRLINVYGSTVKHSLNNYQKEAVEAIKITPPDDLKDIGEEFISMVTMGASMNPDYVAHLETTSSVGGSSTGEFNQSNFISNIPKGDERFLTKGFSDALLRGRIDAAEAIEQYKQGNYEPVKKALRCFLEQAGSNSMSLEMNGTIGLGSLEYGASSMMEKLMNAKLPFPMEDLLTKGEIAKFKSGIYLNKVHHDVLAQVEELQKAPGAPGSAERDEMLSRIVLGLNMTEFYPKERDGALNQGMELGEQLLQRNGIDPKSDDFEALTGGQINVPNVIGMMKREQRFSTELTDLEYVYSRPNADQWVAERFLARLKETPAYQEALREQDPAKLRKRIEAMVHDTHKHNGIAGLATQEDFAQIKPEREQVSATLVEKQQAGVERMNQYVRDAVAEYRQAKALRDMLAKNARALENVPEAAALCRAALELNQALANEKSPILRRTACQEGMREVARLAAAYTRSLRDNAKGTLGEGNRWEPKDPAVRDAFYAARELEDGVTPHIEGPQETRRTVDARIGMQPALRREIERSMDLFDAIPGTNTDKAIRELLRREERYRADHAFDQELLMASGVRTVMLLAAQRRFAPGFGETEAERTHRWRTMKEALSPERVLNNMLAITVHMAHGAITPIEGVTLKDGYNAISGAFIRQETTTEDVRETFEQNIAHVEPYDATGAARVQFYEGSAAFEQSFLNEGKPLPQQSIEAYARVRDAFHGLNDTLAPYYVRGEDGLLPRLTDADFAKIRDGYQNVLAEMNAYSTQMGQSGHPLDMRRMELMDTFREKMGQDLVTLEAGRQLGPATLPNIMLSGNLPAADIVGTPEIYGDMANARMRVTMPGGEGFPVEGFFTATTAVESHIPGIFGRVLDEHTAGHPEWKELIKGIFGYKTLDQNLLSDLKSFREDANRSVDLSGTFDYWMADNRPQLAEQYQRCRGTEFSLALINFAEDYSRQLGLVMEQDHQGLAGNLDKRNSAMSTMAELMKVSGTVVPARAARVRIGGKELVGTFMELADGEDLRLVRKGSPLDIVRVEDMLTPESVSSLADLQVLDYVCGNVDRHNMNMLYKMDTTDPLRPRCVGVQGIDNDFSFCVKPSGKSMADILNMKIIRKETAEALFSLKPEMIKTVLGGYDLDQKETAMVLKRIGELKQAVENGTLKVVTGEQIKTMNYQTELLSSGDNYFERLIAVPQAAHNLAFHSDGAAMDKAYRGLNANTGALGASYDALEEANRGKFIGSKEYRTVLKGLRDLIAHRAELLADRDPERIALYENKLRELRRGVTRYLLKKSKEAQHGKLSKLAQRRVAAFKAFGAKLSVEEAHIQDYREAEANRARNLEGTTLEQEALDRRSRDNQEVDRYLAKGAARELFPKLANRDNPILAKCGATLQAEAEVVFAEAGKPETPELLERRVRLYAGLLADRMLEQQMQKKGNAALKLLDAGEKDPGLFEKLRTAVMNNPGFDREIGKGLDCKLKADPAQWDRAITRIEMKLPELVKGPEKAAPEQKIEQPKAEAPKKPAGPKV